MPAANRDAARPVREPVPAQIASFVELFVWLLVLKSFFLPLFIIPTGSMAESLRGANATLTCPNCGHEMTIGLQEDRNYGGRLRPPEWVQCPNCRWHAPTDRTLPGAVALQPRTGDRIMVHGWNYDFGGGLGPQRWDVVVFKNPNEPAVNYIKRLIGLPGETIEIIDGDVFVARDGDETPRVARKTHEAQEALWFPYYDHDFRPVRPSPPRAELNPQWYDTRGYHPRWIATDPGGGWRDLESRAPRFRAPDGGRSEIQFVTDPDPATTAPGMVEDVYGYNGRLNTRMLPFMVTDVRLSAEVTFEADAGRDDGYVELCVTKNSDQFFARLQRDGTLTLQHAREDGLRGAHDEWGRTRVDTSRPLRLALAHADYRVAVQVNRRDVLESTPQQYPVDIEHVRTLATRRRPPLIRVAAERTALRLANLRIDRDVYYRSALADGRFVEEPGTGTQGRPVRIPDDAYFVLGDNSPQSLDSRWWSEEMLGAHLRPALADDRYAIGTVPADQMIGRAFLVYWPGFMPLPPLGAPALLDLGRVRWIH